MLSGTAGHPPTLAELRDTVATLIGTEPGTIADDANLVHLGMDSLSMMRLVNQLRKKGMRVAVRDLAAEPTLDAWQRYLAALFREG
jgi:aryl carrier-like protein